MAATLSKSDSNGGAKGGGFAGGGASGQVGKTSGPARTSGPQKAGVSSQEGASGAKVASGGNTHMQPHTGAGKLQPGMTANPANGQTFGVPAVGSKSSPSWGVGGGSGMAPNRGSQRQVGGRSSSY
jgi:hypothetical protein